MDRWLTLAEVVERLKVNERTVRRWIADGRLPATLLGRRSGYRIAEADLARFMDERKVAPRVAQEEGDR